MYLIGIILTCAFLVHEQTCSTFSIPQHRLNSALTKNVAKVFLSSRDLSMCANSCMYFADCMSINYVIKDRVCEWLFTSNDSSRMVRGFKGFIHLDMMADWKQIIGPNPCINKPCNLGKICVPSNESYVCKNNDFDYCGKLYFTYLGNDEYKQVVQIPTLIEGSRIDDIWLFSNSGVVIDFTSYDTYIQVNLTRKRFIVRGIITKGNPEVEGVVTSFKISTSPNCSEHSYTYVTNGTDVTEFEREVNFNSPAIHYFDEPLDVACLRLHVGWHVNAATLRMDLIGCIK